MNKKLLLFLPLGFILLIAFNNCSNGNFEIQEASKSSTESIADTESHTEPLNPTTQEPPDTTTVVNSNNGVIQVTGELKHNEVITVTGTGFGQRLATNELYDTVDNQVDFNNLNDGDDVPKEFGPWTLVDSPWAETMQISKTGDLRHQYSTAAYKGINKAFLGWPRAFKDNTNKNLYVSWWFKTNMDLNEYGGHNKLIRIWDDGSGEKTRISWTQILLGAYHPTETHYKGWQGKVNQWNRLEIFADSENGKIKVQTNGETIFDVNDYQKEDSDKGLSIRLIGFDPNYASEYKDLVFKMDDIFASSSPARIEISTSPEWNEEGMLKELQVPIFWSDNKISFKYNKGTLPNSTPLYLYIIDNNDQLLNQSGIKLN